MSSDVAAPPQTFWISPGRLLAGPYAGGWDEAATRSRVEGLVRVGVTLFVDLTEDGELPAYSAVVSGLGARWLRMPVADYGVPSAEQVVATLDAIDEELARDGLVFLHCWGGCGRTGTVAGCWLVRHGLEGAAALATYAELSRVVCGRRCPETEEQQALVLGWSAGR